MKLILASNNPGKIKEFSELLKNINIEIIPQSALNVPDAEETGLTFIENALLKARHAAKLTGLPTLADDSGLCVPALSGAPGIYSARYAGKEATSQANIKKLLHELDNVPDEKRGAFFYCSLVFMRDAKDPAPLICEGRWHGMVLHAPKGEKGFGYDPIFYLPDAKKTAAELPLAEKNRISHRGKALQLLLKLLAEQK